MTWLSKVALIAVVAAFTVVAASACSSAIAQTDEELAAGFTAEKPININIYLPDGGLGTCEQINITGDNCTYGDDVTACCLSIVPPSTEPIGPYCVAYAPSIVEIQQVGKGFCCELYAPYRGPTGWVRFEDETKPCGFCGGKTPGPDECCTANRDVVPKTPIENLADCPDRKQAKEPDHTTPPCGPANAGAIKRAVIPQRAGPVTFEPGCIGHDICYSTCRTDRGVCDVQLHNTLRAACDAYYLPLIDSFKRAGSQGSAISATVGLQNCRDMADDFFGFVSSRGQDAFDTAQKDYCKCCD